MKNLSFADVAGIGLSWAGAVGVIYFLRDSFVSLICVCAAYYLAKWIILKKES
jgi:hypothetical protein